jgi:alpha 1,3-glucosidase
MVAIIDPHIKRVDSFRIYTDARDLDILIKKSDGSNFEGWCWTGNSVWVDFFNPKSWDWWTRMFQFSTWKVGQDVSAALTSGIEPRAVHLERHERAVRV